MSRTQTTYRWQRNAPRLVRRYYWRMILLTVPVPVALFTVGLWKDLLPQSGLWTLAAVMFGVVVLGGLWIAAVGLWEKRLVQQLRAADDKLCPQCRFVLQGHNGGCHCPECGEACDLHKIQAAWRSFRPMITSARD